MIKLKHILYEGGKLFAPHSDRVSTSEMDNITQKMLLTLSDLFSKFEAVKSLKSKETHGDVDLLVLPKVGNWKSKVEERLKTQIVDSAKNGNVHSFLLQFDDISKKVHVDFIVAKDENSMSDYYILNDFSGVVGIFARHLNFKYGDQGFQKRYKDKRNQWHDVFITHNLMEGLEILGYKNPKSKIDTIENLDDIVNFLLESPMMDYEYYVSDNMNVSQRKDVGARDNISYIVKELIAKRPKATIYDEDYFLKKIYPMRYEKLKNEMKRIESETYIQSKYNGQWILDTFGLKPGPIVGDILRQLTKKFGESLDDADEGAVKQFIKTLL